MWEVIKDVKACFFVSVLIGIIDAGEEAGG
jgi:hypothetical protein